MMKRWVWLALIVIVGVGGFFGLRAYQENRKAKIQEGYQTVAIARGPLVAVVGATGSVRANQTGVIAFQTTGIVEDALVEVGDLVHKGEVLAVLEQGSLPAQMILAEADLAASEKALEQLLDLDQAKAMAQLALARAQDALKDAEYKWRVQQEGNRASGDTIEAAKANLILAELEVDKAKRSYDQVSGLPEDDPRRALARSQLSAARQKRDSVLRQVNWYQGRPTDIDQLILDAEVAVAEANLRQAEKDWENAQNGPDARDIAAVEARIAAAMATLEQFRVTAPFAGTITAIDILRDDQASPGKPVFQLADLSRYLIDIEISEVDINKILVGQKVNLAFDAMLDREYQGEVIEVGFSGTLVQGVVSFKVVVELLAPDELIRPGLTAAVSIVVRQIEDVLLVPNRAVRVRDGKRVVYVLRAGTLEEIPVELGASSDLYSEVLNAALQAGDFVVLNPPSVFEQGGQPSFMRP